MSFLLALNTVCCPKIDNLPDCNNTVNKLKYDATEVEKNLNKQRLTRIIPMFRVFISVVGPNKSKIVVQSSLGETEADFADYT